MNRTIRRARIILLIGSMMLAIAAALTLWDLSDADPSDDQVTITGDIDSP